MCQINEVLLDQTTPDEKINAARCAKFVTGHFSWDTLERIGPQKNDFVFTFLRDPRSRLISLHRMMTHNSPFHSNHPLLKKRVALCKGMSDREMFTTENIDLRNMLDNYMVRQFSGRLTDYPVAEEEWPILLERAKNNLASINFVGFQDNFAQDFKVILQQAHLPLFGAIPELNIGKKTGGDIAVLPAGTGKNTPAMPSEMDPLVHWDEQFYEHAKRLRAKPPAQ